jgi:hypothetical protein
MLCQIVLQYGFRPLQYLAAVPGASCPPALSNAYRRATLLVRHRTIMADTDQLFQRIQVKGTVSGCGKFFRLVRVPIWTTRPGERDDDRARGRCRCGAPTITLALAIEQR